MKLSMSQRSVVLVAAILAVVCLFGAQSAWAQYGSISATGTSASMHFNSASGKWLSYWGDNVTGTLTVSGNTTSIVSIAEKLSWETDWVTRSENSNTANVVITPDWAGYYVVQWTVSYSDGMVLSAGYLFNTWRLATDPPGGDHSRQGDQSHYCEFKLCYAAACANAYGRFIGPCPPNECTTDADCKGKG